ncbi:hypothetical protein G4Q83_03035 [Xanthomonas theicola]|nr:hypothetical protein G4Q83_03035 [Xanthomonas theicola]
MLAAVYKSEQNAKSHATRPAGRLRLTASVGYGTLVLAPRLAEFRCSFPDVMIDVRLTDAIVDLGKL